MNVLDLEEILVLGWAWAIDPSLEQLPAHGLNPSA
jgi:hypothetical protein